MPRAASTPLDHPVFNEIVPSADPAGFAKLHPSDKAVYTQIQNLLKKDVVSFSRSRVADGGMLTLQDALGSGGAATIQGIHKAGQIVFHSIGDSGASNAGKYKNEITVADQLTLDCHNSSPADRPAFLFHLGDVVYDFGESQYYYDQFYEPFRNYAAPIFAVPGNHDSFVIPNTPPAQTPLTIFSRNFCATQPTITQEAGSLHRTAMT